MSAFALMSVDVARSDITILTPTDAATSALIVRRAILFTKGIGQAQFARQRATGAVFRALNRQEPAVVIYDTDGKVGRFEHRIKQVCKLAGVEFISWSN